MDQAGPNYMQLRKSKYLQEKLLKLIHPSGRSVFRCHNPKGVNLLTSLRLGLRSLREHKFKYDFLDSLNPICFCGQDIEASTHFLLHFFNHSNERLTFLSIIRNIDRNTLDKNDLKVTETLLRQLTRWYKQHSYHECHHKVPNHHWEIWCDSYLGRMWLCVLLNLFRYIYFLVDFMHFNLFLLPDISIRYETKYWRMD